jgi:nondiscriminating aspartyl-tRNA synthetase
VHNKRDHKKIVFIDLRDHTGIVQVVGDAKLRDFMPEDVVYIKGTVKARPKNLINPKLKTGTIEVEAKEAKLISKAENPPIDLTKEELNVSLPTLLDHRALTIRHPKTTAIFKVQETIIETFRKSLREQGFSEFQAPILVPAQAEGGANTFSVNYFDHLVYLAQSPQLYKQMALGMFEKVFTVTRAFRAEPSVTTRHLTEYVSLDAEMAFIDSWQDIIGEVEYVIRQIVQAVQKNCPDELKMHHATVPKVPKQFPQLKLREAQEIIFKRTKSDTRLEPDLSPSDEEEICKWALEEKGSDFVFITHYPVKKRPFYTYPDPQDPKYTLSFDLLGRGLEWVTGSQRINDYKMLVDNIKEWGNKPENFQLYLEAFRHGMPTEGGFAMGAERITARMLGLENIREASLFPRDMQRVDVRLSTVEDKS